MAMTIRHWSGYGFVSAEELSRADVSDGSVMMKIRVEGNHEEGICCLDPNVIGRWLVEKFDERFQMRDDSAVSVRTRPDLAGDGSGRCDYVIIYRPNNDKP